MTEQELKNEIQRLRDMLNKKNIRVSELLKQNKTLRERRDYWYSCYREISDEYYEVKRCFPSKYYRVEWSGASKNGTKYSHIIELKIGICVAHVIHEIQFGKSNFNLHMIEEVA